MVAEAPAGRAAASALRLFVGSTGLDAAAGAATSHALGPAAEFDLPPAAAAHAKVRRLQPGAELRLFDGESGLDWPAAVLAIGRAAVRVRVGAAPLAAVGTELPRPVTLAFCMPANERVDALVEKATELGAAALAPLMSERSVLRLAGERAERRRAHWQAVAAAACEQCGRARVPRVHAVQALGDWLQRGAGGGDAQHAGRAPGGNVLRWLLSTQPDAPPLAEVAAADVDARAAPARIVVLSGPEGGFSPAEHAAAIAAGCTAVSLGPRILRADTAPMAVLAWLAIAAAQRPDPKSGA